MSEPGTGIVARRHIGETLERLRTEAGLERTDAAAHLGKTRETIRRWETGAVCPDTANIGALCRLYGANSETLSHLSSLALKVKDSSLFEGLNVPDGLRLLVESERTAREIRSIELAYVPGLLQTLEYHRATQTAQLPGDEDARREFRELRQQRHKAVFRNPPNLQFLLGTGVLDLLDRWDDKAAREEQLQRLRQIATLRTVDIRVIVGFHAAMLGAFTIVTPRKSALAARPFAYVQDVDGARYIEKPDVVSLYERTFAHVREHAIPLEEYLT